jgi:cyanate lyase
VALQKSFVALRGQLRELQEVLEALNTTVEEDRPRRKDVVVASSLGDAVLAVRGLLEESCAAADEACEAVGQSLDLDRARRALITCQERFHRFAAEFSHDLASCERMADLASVARERGRDWASWVKVVKQGLAQCQALVEEGREALFLCWQDLSERLGTASVSVRNTSIGQLAKDFDRRERLKG